MSYDLMVFDGEVAPKGETEFLAWYSKQCEWSEDHSYDDHAITSESLNKWFQDIIKFYPPMNGPLASEDLDDDTVTDYSIGRNVIYAAFAWSEAQGAIKKTVDLAMKHNIGFFNVSGDGEIFRVDSEGDYAWVNDPKPWWKFW